MTIRENEIKKEGCQHHKSGFHQAQDEVSMSIKNIKKKKEGSQNNMLMSTRTRDF